MKFENMPRYSKYLCWYITELEKKRSTKEMTVAVLFMFIIAGLLSLLMVRCANEPWPVYKSHYSEEEIKLASIFAGHGSTNPYEMAIAVRKTKNPPLMAAIAIKESNGRLKAIGDGGKSKGAFQVQEKHWGKVGKTATEQALQAERILEELVQSSRGRLLCGLSKYNAGRADSRAGRRYAKKVIALARQLKKERAEL